MKRLFQILGGIVVLALIIGAMYIALSIGISVYLAHVAQARMQAMKNQPAFRMEPVPAKKVSNDDMGPGAPVDWNSVEASRGKRPTLLVDSGGYNTEDNWLATGISREIAEMAFVAAHPDKPLPDLKIKATVDPDQPQVHVEINGFDAGMTGPLSSDLTPAFAWDFTGYAPLARQLLGSTPGLPPVAKTDATDVLGHLLTLTGPEIALEDMRISADLQQQPNSWANHEAAALVLSALALREVAGSYSDNRTLLNRATAHLAIAQVLRGDQPATLPGLIAGAAVRTLSGREVDALEHLDSINVLPNLPDSARTWSAALRTLATQDWRFAKVAPSSPLLLKIAWAQVAIIDLPPDTTLDRFLKLVPSVLPVPNAQPGDQKINPETLVPDWCRSFGPNPFANVAGYNLDSGTDKLSLELHELDEILQAEGSPPLDLSKLGEILSQKETGTISRDASGKTIVQVIGPATFKSTTRRHLLASIPSIDPSEQSGPAGTRAQAQFFRCDKLLQGVPIYDIARQHTTFVDMSETMNAYTTWLAAQKTWNVWDVPMDLTDGMPGYAYVKYFYRNAVPFGTVYQPYIRFDFIRAIGAPIAPRYDTPEFDRIQTLPLKEQAAAMIVYNQKYQASLPAPLPPGPTPFERKLLRLDPDLYLLAVDRVPTDQLPKVAARFLDYNMTVSSVVGGLDAKHLSSTDARQILTKDAAMDPIYYFNLGKSLRKEGKEDEAAAADRKGLAGATDQATAISSAGHLLQYDLCHGLNDEALSIGKRAEDIYPYLYFDALEGTGHLEEAETCAIKISNSYDDTSPEIQLYAGHPDRFPQQCAAEQKRIFPDGIKKADLASFSGAPTKGMIFDAPKDDPGVAGELTPSHLQVDDVMVALDGYRIDTAMQYFYIKSLSRSSTMDFVVWRDGKYREVKAYAPNRRFTLTISNLVPVK